MQYGGGAPDTNAVLGDMNAVLREDMNAVFGDMNTYSIGGHECSIGGGVIKAVFRVYKIRNPNCC